MSRSFRDVIVLESVACGDDDRDDAPDVEDDRDTLSQQVRQAVTIRVAKILLFLPKIETIKIIKESVSREVRPRGWKDSSEVVGGQQEKGQ